MFNYFWKIKMNKTTLTSKKVCLIIIVFSLLSANVTADNNRNISSPKAKERMDMIKKMKMIDAMELDEAKSEKFLIKFNSYSKQLEEKRKQQQELVDKLNEATNNTSKDLSKLADQMLSLQNEINKIHTDKNQDIRGILSEKEFAKFLVFENNFISEVFNCFMNHNHHNNDIKFKNKAKKEMIKDNKKTSNKN